MATLQASHGKPQSSLGKMGGRDCGRYPVSGGGWGGWQIREGVACYFIGYKVPQGALMIRFVVVVGGGGWFVVRGSWFVGSFV